MYFTPPLLYILACDKLSYFYHRNHLIKTQESNNNLIMRGFFEKKGEKTSTLGENFQPTSQSSERTKLGRVETRNEE